MHSLPPLGSDLVRNVCPFAIYSAGSRKSAVTQKRVLELWGPFAHPCWAPVCPGDISGLGHSGERLPFSGSQQSRSSDCSVVWRHSRQSIRKDTAQTLGGCQVDFFLLKPVTMVAFVFACLIPSPFSSISPIPPPLCLFSESLSLFLSCLLAYFGDLTLSGEHPIQYTDDVL